MRAALLPRPRLATAYHPSFAFLDGTNDYLLRGAALTGIANGKVGTLSMWLFLTGGDGVLQRLFTSANNRVLVSRSAANKITIQAQNAAATEILGLTTVPTTTIAGSLYHLLASWDMAGAVQVYINDNPTGVNVSTQTNDTINYATPANWSIGANTAGASKVAGHIAELYFNTVAAIDFSDPANRRKFRDEYGRPVDLGTDGSVPTGTAPIMYHSLRSSTPADFATNRGTGGNFAVTGALDLGYQMGLAA